MNRTVKGGANHGDNMYYESFENDVTSISETQKELSGAYHAYLTSLITMGDPNKLQGKYGSCPVWTEYSKSSQKVMTFGEGYDECAGGDNVDAAARMRGSAWLEKECEFWWKMNYATEE